MTVGELTKGGPIRSGLIIVVSDRSHRNVGISNREWWGKTNVSRAALSARARTKTPFWSCSLRPRTIIYTNPNANKHDDCATPS